jgi:hypothetical protein
MSKSFNNTYGKTLLCILFYWGLSFNNLYAQSVDEKPNEAQLSPFDAMHIFSHYSDEAHFNDSKAAAVFLSRGKKGKNLAVMLKQVLDGKGQKIRLSQIPEDENYMDSLSKKNVYLPFQEYGISREKLKTKFQICIKGFFLSGQDSF